MAELPPPRRDPVMFTPRARTTDPPPVDFEWGTPQPFTPIDAPPPRPPDWPPPGMTTIEPNRIIEAIEGYTIITAGRIERGCVLELQAPELPGITLEITDDGYWIATIEGA